MDKSTETTIVEAVKQTPYRDERGVRIQKYRRFKDGEDYEAVEPDEMSALMQNMIDNIDTYELRCKVGQPPKYESVESFRDVTRDYLNYIKDANLDKAKLIPDIEGLCAFMGISRETLNEWERSRAGEYSDTIKMVKNQIAFFKKQLALKGKTPAIVFATDFNNNHGYVQKQEISIPQINPLGDSMDAATLQKQIDSLPEATVDFDSN